MGQRLEGLPCFDGFEPCPVGVPAGTPYPEDHKIIVNVSFTALIHQI